MHRTLGARDEDVIRGGGAPLEPAECGGTCGTLAHDRERRRLWRLAHFRLANTDQRLAPDTCVCGLQDANERGLTSVSARVTEARSDISAAPPSTPKKRCNPKSHLSQTHTVPQYHPAIGQEWPFGGGGGALYAQSISPVALCPLCVRVAGMWQGRQCTVSDNESEGPEQSRTFVDGTGQIQTKR